MTSSTKASLIFIFVFSYLYSHGQSAIGLKAGGHLTSWKLDLANSSRVEMPTTNFDFQFGGLFEIRLNDLISIQPEFLYLNKGVRFIDKGENFERQFIYSFNYFELPVLLKLRLVDLHDISFYLIGGPSFGYAVSGEFNTISVNAIDTEIETTKIDFEANSNIRRFDISASYGAGVGFPMGIGNLEIETRYLISLTSIFDYDFPDDSVKNIGVSISIGYAIPLSKNKKDGK